ncbi:hypothetical protein [uncultured Clostridium sp.]|uniref:hypothetical protein n=1 Tax=uncultured Clostridium sp. TaxID=59620 RepID=UPI0028ECA364|nr:hypothetical protein [uncultured Clostridium sp.]
MNKRLKMIVSTVVLGASLLSAIPANAATTSNVDTGSINKVSSIQLRSSSTNRPSSDFNGGILWCTGNGVYIREANGNKIKTVDGYAVMNRGEAHRFEGVVDGRAYFELWDGTTVYVSTTYLSTVEV